jgi:hypothetical protein
VPLIEVVRDEFGGEPVEELRVNGGIGDAGVVDGIDEAATEEVGENAVGLSAGKPRVVGRCDPGGYGFESVGVAGERMVRAEEPRLVSLAGAGILECAVVVDENDLLAIELVLVVRVLPAVLEDFVVDLREDVAPAVVIVLRPAIKGMAVTLRALEAEAEEDLGRGFGPGFGIAEGAIIVGRRLGVGTATRGEEPTGEDIEGSVVGELGADPGMKVGDPFAVESALFVAEEVGPLDGPELGELGTLQERVDEVRVVCRGWDRR